MTVRKRGKSWQAIVRIKKDGKLHEESETFTTEALAKDWKARVLAKIKLYGIPQRTLSVLTLGDLISKYREAVNEAKPLRRQMEWEMEQLANEFKSVRLNQLSSKVFTDFGRRRAAAGRSPATVMHNLATVRGVLNGAKPVLGVDVTGDTVTQALTALQRIGAVSKSEERTRRPTSAELLALRDEFIRISGNPGTIIPMATFLALAVELPRRREELLGMKWVDYTGSQITLHDTKNPNGYRTEIVPVPAPAAAIIDSLPRIDARILPYKPESVSASFQRACERLKIEDLRLHDLRHEGISRLFEQGLNIPEVSLISGHQSWATLKRYTHITGKQVLDKLTNHAREKSDANHKEKTDD
jgi:integrase